MQRATLVGLGLIALALALTWVVLYLNAGATSGPLGAAAPDLQVCDGGAELSGEDPRQPRPAPG